MAISYRNKPTMNHILNSCVPCALKKRKCDRGLPKCSTCARSKTKQDCVYKNPLDGQFIHFDKELSQLASLPLPTRPSPQQLQKSLMACEKCRLGKRACSKDLPKCSRCQKINIPCTYELTKSQPKAPYELQVKEHYPVPEKGHFPELVYTYCEMFFLPDIYRSENSLTTHLHTTWMRRAMADPCLFHGTMFCASAHLDWIHGVSHNPRTLFHQSQALRLLRERLKGEQIGYETTATALALTFYNMSAYNTETALVHKNGLLKMISLSKEKSPDFEALTGLVTLILLGVSMAMNQPPPFIQATSAPVNSSILLKSSYQPSNLLSRTLLRYTGNGETSLFTSTISELQNVLDFILIAENASLDEMYTLYFDAMERRTTIPLIDLSSTKTRTTRNINQSCHLAVELFWDVFQNALYPELPPTTPPITQETSPPSTLSTLHAILQKVDLVSWQKLAPEVYIWICLTAAAACDESADRIPFITTQTPVLSASDSAELRLTREGWRYFKWLVGFV
ncbi:hypothetical protein BDV12DRAFT_174448 [Aspergillus spectabilis]